MECERYAIWFIPPEDSPLARFGRAWTGWCPESGSRQKGGALSRFADLHANLPAHLRLGGLHVSISPSFRLAEGRSPWALERALAEFAASMSPITLPPLRLEIKGTRVRLAFDPAPLALTELAAAVAEALRPLHRIVSSDGAASAEMSGHGEAIRRADVADATDPAVRPCFWLSGSSSAAARIVEKLTPILAPILEEPITLSDLTLIYDPGGNRPWRVLERFELQESAGTAERPIAAGMDCIGPKLFMPLLPTEWAA